MLPSCWCRLHWNRSGYPRLTELKWEDETHLMGFCVVELVAAVAPILPASCAGCWLWCLDGAAVAAAEEADVQGAVEVVGEDFPVGRPAKAVV